MQFHELEVKILEFKDKKYNFSIMIIEEFKKNFIKQIRLNLYPWFYINYKSMLKKIVKNNISSLNSRKKKFN